jgi:hypothetical protein
MPIWAILYLLLVLALMAHGYWDKTRREGFRWRSLVDLASLAALVWLYMTFWSPSSWGRLGLLAPILYVPLLVDAFISMNRTAKEAARLEEVPPGDWIDLAAAYLTNLAAAWLVLAVLMFPFLIIAGLSALQMSRM